jgi:hypothetical protein
LLLVAATGLATFFDSSAQPTREALYLSWAPSASDAALPAGWRELTFKNIPRHTRYALVKEASGYVLKAQASASASGLMHPMSADPKVTPVLRWRWKVANLIAKGDPTKKAGDDYPARVYVAFAYDRSRASFAQRVRYEAIRLLYGEYPPHAGLNYIWDVRTPVGTIVANAFTDRVRMFVVESGAQRVGEWIAYERDVYADYLQAFKEAPPPISGIAVMTDADNTGETATAWYGEISLSPR